MLGHNEAMSDVVEKGRQRTPIRLSLTIGLISPQISLPIHLARFLMMLRPRGTQRLREIDFSVVSLYNG